MDNSKDMTDREKVLFLRSYGINIGHTDGTPFDAATLTLESGRSFNIYSMKEIQDLLHHLHLVAVTDTASPTDIFVYRWLIDNGVIYAFSELADHLSGD